MMIRYFDMFAGIGGFRSGPEAVGGFECVGYCEINPTPGKHTKQYMIQEVKNSMEIQPRSYPNSFPISTLCAEASRVNLSQTLAQEKASKTIAECSFSRLQELLPLRNLRSFAADSTDSAKTYEMNASGNSYTLTDSNSVLDKFNFSFVDGMTVSRSGNKLTLTSKSPITSAVTLRASRSVSGAGVSLIAYGDSGLQDVVPGASGITVNAYFKIKATPGSLNLVKTSEDEKVSGTEFTVAQAISRSSKPLMTELSLILSLRLQAKITIRPQNQIRTAKYILPPYPRSLQSG